MLSIRVLSGALSASEAPPRRYETKKKTKRANAVAIEAPAITPPFESPVLFSCESTGYGVEEFVAPTVVGVIG